MKRTNLWQLKTPVKAFVYDGDADNCYNTVQALGGSAENFDHHNHDHSMTIGNDGTSDIIAQKGEVIEVKADGTCAKRDATEFQNLYSELSGPVEEGAPAAGSADASQGAEQAQDRE